MDPYVLPTPLFDRSGRAGVRKRLGVVPRAVWLLVSFHRQPTAEPLPDPRRDDTFFEPHATIEHTTMQDLPPYPAVDDASDVFASGHLWVEELIVGDPLRFRMTDAGYLEFGDAEEAFAHDAVPLRYRHAVRAVRESFAGEAFRDAVEDPTTVTFVCVAVHRVDDAGNGDANGATPAYDWARTPSVLGTDVYDAERGRFLPRDVVRTVFDRVGLPTVEPVAQELRAADVAPASYPIPDSAWYDGPAAGIVFHNKGGGRAVRRRRSADDHGENADPDDRSLDEFLDDHVTDVWLGRVRGACEATGDPVTVETLTDRALEGLARETVALTGSDAFPASEVRSALATRVDRHLRTGA